MAITVTCESCGKTLRTKDSAAGKQARCPDCGDPIVIPLPQASDEEADVDGLDDGGYEDGGYYDEPNDDGWDSGGSGQGSVGARCVPKP